MTNETWKVTFQVFRKKGEEQGHLERFELEVSPDEYVLDGIERIWAYQDRSLSFRHACHHSTCGACGMRVNGVEKLTCITPIRDVTEDGGTVRVEPLRNFPLVSDLVVDMSSFYVHMEQTGFPAVAPLNKVPDAAGSGIKPAEKAPDDIERLVDCIECGLCISACPIVGTDRAYVGPAVLAAIHHQAAAGETAVLRLADHSEGAWRCHSAFECSEVCPAFVDPAARIMQVRKMLVGQGFKRLFAREER